MKEYNAYIMYDLAKNMGPEYCFEDILKKVFDVHSIELVVGSKVEWPDNELLEVEVDTTLEPNNWYVRIITFDGIIKYWGWRD